MRNIRILLTLSLVALFITVQPAHAYLDPGTGSYILQMILAGTLGGLYIFKGYIGRLFGGIKSLLTKSSGKETNASEEK